MQINRTAFRTWYTHDDEECHTEEINLCFGCAVKAIMRGEDVVEYITEDNENYYCGDCYET